MRAEGQNALGDYYHAGSQATSMAAVGNLYDLSFLPLFSFLLFFKYTSMGFMKIVLTILIVSLLKYVLYAENFSESTIQPWGADSELAACLDAASPLSTENLTAGQRSCRFLIRFFQIYISPIDGPRSSYYPSSSQYTLEAIERYGMFQGIVLGCDRLMRENKEPWIYPLTFGYGTERKSDPVPTHVQ